jgi:hypothetical protein
MHPSRPFAAAALFAAATGLSSAQSSVAAVADLGPGCGPPAAVLSSTLPVVGGDVTFRLDTGVPLAYCDIVLSPPNGAPPLVYGSGCPIYVDFLNYVALGPFYADAAGVLTTTFPLPNTPTFLGVPCVLQALCFSGPDVGFSNGVGLLDGANPPYCSWSQGGFGGGGTPGGILAANFASTFASAGFLEVGVYGANGAAAPNGVRFTADATGLAALSTWLGGGGSPAAFGTDAVNPTSTGGGVAGGNLGKQTTALALNVAFNDAGVAGSSAPGYSSLVYRASGDALDGFTVAQILTVAHFALSGLGLPGGHSFGSLTSLVDELNRSFDPCVISPWARLHLFVQ